MNAVGEWLAGMKARDVMSRGVVALHPSDRLSDAVTMFLREQISGAPVLDDKGVCVGVFSATDILNFQKHADAPVSTPKRRLSHFDTYAGADWWREFGQISEQIGSEELDKSVAEFMTRDIVSVMEETPLAVVVRYMIDAHVHRVLVLDARRCLKGIVTTMDVLSAALRSARREQLSPEGGVLCGCD